MTEDETHIAADDYAQKFGDNEHRVFALAQRRTGEQGSLLSEETGDD